MAAYDGRQAFQTIAARTEHRMPEKLEKLAGLMAKEIGVRVTKADALNKAVDEAIRQREGQQ